jgi:hypothetical protein
MFYRIPEHEARLGSRTTLKRFCLFLFNYSDVLPVVNHLSTVLAPSKSLACNCDVNQVSSTFFVTCLLVLSWNLASWDKFISYHIGIYQVLLISTLARLKIAPFCEIYENGYL